MRHQVFGRKLGRDTNSRKALLSNLASAIIVNGKITTTLAKAKFARPYVEKLVTAAKIKKLHLGRTLASQISHEALLRLIGGIGPGFIERAGGYTRIVKLSMRRGDSSPMARLEFVEYPKLKSQEVKVKTEKRATPTTALKSSSKANKIKTEQLKAKRKK